MEENKDIPNTNSNELCEMAAIPGTIFQLLVIEGKVICGWENDFVAYVARYPQTITEVENALKYAVNQLRALSAPQAQA